MPSSTVLKTCWAFIHDSIDDRIRCDDEHHIKLLNAYETIHRLLPCWERTAMKDQHDSEQDWSGNLEGAAEPNDRQHEQAEHRKRRPSSPRRKKKSKHHSKKKKRHNELTAREEDIFANDQAPVAVGAASLPPMGCVDATGARRNDQDSSFTNLLATFTDQNDGLHPKGMTGILHWHFPHVHASHAGCIARSNQRRQARNRQRI